MYFSIPLRHCRRLLYAYINWCGSLLNGLIFPTTHINMYNKNWMYTFVNCMYCKFPRINDSWFLYTYKSPRPESRCYVYRQNGEDGAGADIKENWQNADDYLRNAKTHETPTMNVIHHKRRRWNDGDLAWRGHDLLVRIFWCGYNWIGQGHHGVQFGWFPLLFCASHRRPYLCVIGDGEKVGLAGFCS